LSSCNYYWNNLIYCAHPSISCFAKCRFEWGETVGAFQASTSKPLIITIVRVVIQSLPPHHTICAVCIYGHRICSARHPITRTTQAGFYHGIPIKHVDCSASTLIDSEYNGVIYPTPRFRDIFGCILNHSRIVVVIVDDSSSHIIIIFSISRSSSKTSREYDKCPQHENVQILAQVHDMGEEAGGLYVHSVEKVMSYVTLVRCVNG
jgi:hypothetical protein